MNPSAQGNGHAAQIQLKGTELRDRTSDTLKNALVLVRFDTHKITAGGREKAGQQKQLVQDRPVRQLDRLSTALSAGKTAVKAAWDRMIRIPLSG
jgi:hypothetical protein